MKKIYKYAAIVVLSAVASVSIAQDAPTGNGSNNFTVTIATETLASQMSQAISVSDGGNTSGGSTSQMPLPPNAVPVTAAEASEFNVPSSAVKTESEDGSKTTFSTPTQQISIQSVGDIQVRTETQISGGNITVRVFGVAPDGTTYEAEASGTVSEEDE